MRGSGEVLADQRSGWVKEGAKPCPFCGSEKVRFRKIREPLPGFEESDGGDWMVGCWDCGTQFIIFHTNDLYKKWNRRKE